MDFKNQKDLFREALESDFSISEIQQIWRQILTHFLSISPIEQIAMGDHQFSPQDQKQLMELLIGLEKRNLFSIL